MRTGKRNMYFCRNKKRASEGALMEQRYGPLALLGFCLQNFNRAAQLLIFFRLRLLRLVVWSAVIVIRDGDNVIAGGYLNVRRDAGILNDLAIRCVVFGDGKNQRRAVWHFNQFLYGAFAK